MARSFEIVRRADAEPAFLYNNVLVRYAGTCPETGVSFYCSLRENYGVRVNPDGRRTLVNACKSSYSPEDKRNFCRKQRYLKFYHAFGHHKTVFVAHAVVMAAGRSVPEGMQIDHINGCTCDNALANLRCIDRATNCRDGGFLQKLRNKGLRPEHIQRHYLLRYFHRMARIKEALSRRQYRKLTADDLKAVLYAALYVLSDHMFYKYNVKISFLL